MNLNEPVHTIRAVTPRSEVLFRIALAQDRWAEAEQMHALVGNDSMAEEAHAVALRLLRAYLAEADDPIPEGL